MKTLKIYKIRHVDTGKFVGTLYHSFFSLGRAGKTYSSLKGAQNALARIGHCTLWGHENENHGFELVCYTVKEAGVLDNVVTQTQAQHNEWVNKQIAEYRQKIGPMQGVSHAPAKT